MAPNNWIELRSGMGGQPVLVENRHAYTAFDAPRFPPRVLVAIGGQSNCKMFNNSPIPQISTQAHIPGIRIQPWHSSQVLIDCELHTLSNLRPVKVLPSMGYRQERSLQALVPPTRSHQSFAKVAFDFYWQVLIPFTTTVLLFLDDLEDHDSTIEMLGSWVKRSILEPVLSPPRVFLLYTHRTKDVSEFMGRLRLRLVAFATSSGAVKNASDADIIQQCDTAFERIQLLPLALMTPDCLYSCVEEAFSFRERAGFAFKAEHLRDLLENAVGHFCDGLGRQPDLYRGSRHANPLREDLGEHIRNFLEASQDLLINHVDVIASALDFDAHPPQMHRK